jgi:uncharacterized phiE125 gp8 family phage protein
MSLTRLAAPSAADPVVTLSDMKRQLRVTHNDEDAFIETLVATAVALLEGRSGYLSRALVSQQWRMSVDCFPCRYLEMPLPPLISVESIKYLATDGVETTLATSEYVVDIALLQGRVRPAYGKTWPATLADELAVRVEFTAGYGAASAVPLEIKQAIKMLVTHWYMNRGDIGTIPLGTATAVSSLIGSHREAAF